MTHQTSDLARRLANPAYSLPIFAKIINQKSGQLTKYDPMAITHKLQATILDYVADPPRTEPRHTGDLGQTKWLTLVGYRQGGKSLVGELAFYPKSAYNVGHDHVCIADKRERAEYLHKRVQLCHDNWPHAARSPTIPNRETRQLTFDIAHGGKMRTLTAGGRDEGIGQSFDSFHGSEVPFWPDAADTMMKVVPAMINRDNVLVIMESTPAPGGARSLEYFKDIYYNGKHHRGRWVSAFFPFWDGKLNVRPWPRGLAPDLEELRLLDKYGGQGLTLENLSFRRHMLEIDPELRRRPELFGVWYPFDDITCWASAGSSAIPFRLIQKHVHENLLEWDHITGYKEYEVPEEGANYVIGVDPAGYGSRDHAAFQVLKVYDSEWTQVAAYGRITDPVDFTKTLLRVAKKYNMAFIVPEANGVGAAVISLLEQANYTNMYYRGPGKPGAVASTTTNEKYLSYLIDALMECLVLNDSDTVQQMTTYKNDKMVERSASSEILTGDATGNLRRGRHHWDKISALIYAVVGARTLPQRRKHVYGPENAHNVFYLSNMTYGEQESYRTDMDKDAPKPTTKKGGYKRASPYRRRRR